MKHTNLWIINAYFRRQLTRPLRIAFSFMIAAGISFILAGCSSRSSQSIAVLGPHELVQKQNSLFLQQKAFDPWKLTSTDPSNAIPAYVPSGKTGNVCAPVGAVQNIYCGGQYDKNGSIVVEKQNILTGPPATNEYSQTLDLQQGTLSTVSETSSTRVRSTINWPAFWNASDIVITGDPEAQQVTHTELFDLCGSAAAGTDDSIPPMGLSSNVYAGHIFWDAEIWMMPAFLPQHPDLARSIVDYRFKRLAAAETLAKAHGFAGAEFPWESAETGLEQAPEEFSHERHITADVAYAAWQYYLWTGDKQYLSSEGWPVLSETANYWVSRATLGADGKYHIARVIGPDETAGLVTDDAWTNAVVRYNLLAATQAANLIGRQANPKWATVANQLLVPFDSASQTYLQYPAVDQNHHQAKQADTQMLIYPLNLPMESGVAANTLNDCTKHTIAFGPAMTSSINAVIAARIGETQPSLDYYHDSYRPFMRGPWDAFSEKRSKSDVYFTTGMGGNLQVVLYGFAGLNVVAGSERGQGALIARSDDAALYADPHLPPGWTGLTIKGVQFRGKVFTINIASGNVVNIVR
jgi:trehalose/maltose hydrolase-like predicted phosphorylase